MASLEGRTVKSDVVEMYVPLMRDNRFEGAFEIYYDITDKREELKKADFPIFINSIFNCCKLAYISNYHPI